MFFTLQIKVKVCHFPLNCRHYFCGGSNNVNQLVNINILDLKFSTARNGMDSKVKLSQANSTLHNSINKIQVF